MNTAEHISYALGSEFCQEITQNVKGQICIVLSLNNEAQYEEKATFFVFKMHV